MNDVSPQGGSKAALRIAQWCLPIIGLALALLIVEIAFRLIRPSLKRKAWSDRPYGYFMPTDAITLQDGALHPKAPGTFRVGVVGDSFTFGPNMHLDDTFPKRLERWLNVNGSSSGRVEVLNRGSSGFGTANEVEIVRKTLREEIDLLVLEITLNDAEPHTITAEERKELFEPPDVPLFRAWSSLGFLFARLNNSSTYKAYVDYHTKYFKDPKSYAVFRDSIGKAFTAARDANVPMVAMIFPFFDFPFDRNYPLLETHRIISATLDGHGIRHLDLKNAYTGIPHERLQVIPGTDSHPNEIAHRIAAEHLLAFLVSEHLVPEWSVPRRVFRSRRDLRSKSADPKRLWERAAKALKARHLVHPAVTPAS